MAVNALFHQSGVIRADTIDEMFDVAACLESQPLPRGRRVGIVTNAGGPGILAVDACEAAGLTVVEFTAATRARLAEFLPPEASIGNPVDMIASAGPHQFQRAIETVMTADDVDAVIVIFTPVDRRVSSAIVTAIRDGIVAGRAAGAADKPVLACVMATPGVLSPLEAGDEKVPAYGFPENAARALGKVAAYAGWRGQAASLYWSFDDVHVHDARAVCTAALARGGSGWLTPDETRQLLGSCNLPHVTAVLVRTAEDAVAEAARVGFPVVMKLQSSRVLHKSDVGAVRVGLSSESAVRIAFHDLSGLQPSPDITTLEVEEGVVVQAMITGGVETMIGVTDDPLFGPLIGFGLGGIHVEVLRDIQFRIAPLSDRDAEELVTGIRGFRLLQGYRGHPPADVDALRDLVLRISLLADAVPEIAELDLNPVIALAPGQGCRIVDARIRVAARRTAR